MRNYYDDCASIVSNNKRRKMMGRTTPMESTRCFVELTSASFYWSSTVPRSQTLSVKVIIPKKETSTSVQDAATAEEITENKRSEQTSQSANEESAIATVTASISKTETTTSDEATTIEKPKEKRDGSQKIETKIVDLAHTDAEYYDEKERTVLLANSKMESAKKEIYKEQIELWGVYMYGLQHVMTLNDLAAAPDAILPGNF